MLDWLLNFGTGLPAWTNFFAVVIATAWAVWLIKDLWKIGVSVTEGDDKWKPIVKPAVIKGFLFAVMLYAALVAFGPGTPPQELPSDIGVMEYVDKAPDMKTPAEIQKEAEAKVNPFLKKQREGFKAEQEEADAYLENLRKKYQNQ